MTPDDAAVLPLLRACAHGDVAAFSRLYDATSVVVYRLSLMILGDEERATSNTRSTFMTVWEQAGRYDRSLEGDALSWMVTIAYTRARHTAGRPLALGGA